MKFLRKWGALMVVLGVLAVGLGTLAWYTSRPVVLDPAKLTPAETVETFPGAELSLELNGALIDLTFSNHSDAQLESGASVDGDRNFFSPAACRYCWRGSGMRYLRRSMPRPVWGWSWSRETASPGSTASRPTERCPTGSTALPLVIGRETPVRTTLCCVSPTTAPTRSFPWKAAGT